jgi:N-acetylglucosaminyl-diphospho-decaprenol L-rhamnosyltransferase
MPPGGARLREPEGALLTVVIVTYRSAAEIGACLDAISRATSDIPAEIIVVDSASGDDTAKRASRAAPSAKVIEREVNEGFASACNLAGEVASGDWLLFLNPDTVISAGAVAELLACAGRHADGGIFGGRFVHADGSPDPRSCWGRPSLWSALCFGLGLSSLFPGSGVFDPESPPDWSADRPEDRQVAVISGALMLVRRGVWDELGGFDQDFYLYGEDADFCLRAARAGWTSVVTSRAVCLHSGGKSSSSVDKLVRLFTGKVSVIQRHFPPGLRWLGLRLLLTGVLLRAVGGRVVGTLAPARQGRPTQRADDWRALWQARASWRRGWPKSGPR